MIAEHPTKLMIKIIAECEALERRIYRKDAIMYIQCTAIAKHTWNIIKEGKINYDLEIEPAVFGIYSSVCAELTKLKFRKTRMEKLYNNYLDHTKGELENKSRLLSDEIWNTTNLVMMEGILK